MGGSEHRQTGAPPCPPPLAWPRLRLEHQRSEGLPWSLPCTFSPGPSSTQVSGSPRAGKGPAHVGEGA